MKTPIRTYKTAELYMQQGYFEEARDVLRALEAENPADPAIPGLYRRLDELVKEAELNPPVQQLERIQEESETLATVPPLLTKPEPKPWPTSPSCCDTPPVERRKYIPAPDASRTQRLVNAATDVGIDIAQRAVTGLVKGLNRVITRIQERKGGL